MFLGDRRLTMLSVSEMVDVLDFDFDMEEKVANHLKKTFTQPAFLFLCVGTAKEQVFLKASVTVAYFLRFRAQRSAFRHISGGPVTRSPPPRVSTRFAPRHPAGALSEEPSC